MNYLAYLALTAWLVPLARSAAMAKRDSSASQMQYGGSISSPFPSFPAPSSLQSSTNTDEQAWPTEQVPGMNVYDIYSYELDHNFELKPSRTSQHTSSSSSSYLTPDLPLETINTPASVKRGISPATTPAPSGFTTSQILAPRRNGEGIIVGDKNGYVGEGQMAVYQAQCSADNIGLWNPKRRSLQLKAADIVARYLPFHAFRARQLEDGPRGALARRTELPYGVMSVVSGRTIYTDQKAYEKALITWENARTVWYNPCGSGSPLFFQHTTPTTTKTKKTKSTTKPKPLAKAGATTQGVANANGAHRVNGGIEGGETLNVKRTMGGEALVASRSPEEPWEEPRRLDEGEWDGDSEEGGEEHEDDDDDADEGEVVVIARDVPFSVEAGVVTRADTFNGDGPARATPAPWTA